MKKVLFITNLPAPYKITYFNILSKQMDLTVIYERKNATDRNSKWKSVEGHHFREIYLQGKEIGNESSFAPKIIRHIKKNYYDAILMNGYGSPTMIIAITYMRIHHIKFGMICDGMLSKHDGFLKSKMKYFLISSADFWLSSGKVTSQQLEKYGAKAEKIYLYPFSSVKAEDILKYLRDTKEYKKRIGCKTDKMILYVGQIVQRKGVDILINAFKKSMINNCCLYIVGGGK